MTHYTGSLSEIEAEIGQQLQARSCEGMWTGRAERFLHHALPALFELSVRTNTPLTHARLMEGLAFKTIVRLSQSPRISQPSKALLRAYLANLPGYTHGGHVQAECMHGYISMMFDSAILENPSAT